eukprot:15569441-Heterocapsa_arctica.AAC.1
MAAEDIDFWRMNLKKDSTKLVSNKKRGGGDTYSCEQQVVEQIHIQETQNYNKWKFKKRNED